MLTATLPRTSADAGREMGASKRRGKESLLCEGSGPGREPPIMARSSEKGSASSSRAGMGSFRPVRHAISTSGGSGWMLRAPSGVGDVLGYDMV